VIAKKLGMKAESLSRVFQRLRKHGVIIKNDMAIIDDIAKLHLLLEGSESSRFPKHH
jgi:DNA-binding Lrp family transcriptional regulator